MNPAINLPTDRDAEAPANRTSLFPSRRKLIGSGLTLFFGLVFAFPLFLIVVYALKTTDDIIRDQYPLSIASFIPLRPTFENFSTLFSEVKFHKNILNTMIVSAGQVISSVIVSTLAGYAFARLSFRFRDAIFAVILVASFFSVEAILVPVYTMTRDLGLVSTYLGLFLPFCASPFGIYLMRQSFRAIPLELEEAARLDGANPWRIFFSIALPNVYPAVATLVLIQFIWSWNAYLWPLVAMQNSEKQIAQVALASLRNFPSFPMDGPMFAGAAILTLPLVVIATFLQKYYVKGLASSGMK